MMLILDLQEIRAKAETESGNPVEKAEPANDLYLPAARIELNKKPKLEICCWIEIPIPIPVPVPTKMDTVRPPKRKPVGGLVAEFESETVAHCLCHTALPFFDGGNINGYQLHSSKCQGSLQVSLGFIELADG